MKVPVRHQIQEDETLLSWVARWCRVEANLNESGIIKQLVGKQRVRFHPYLPHHILVLSGILNMPPEHLLYQHTLYPLFAYFERDEEEKLRRAMLSSDVTSTVILAGIPHAKLGFAWPT